MNRNLVLTISLLANVGLIALTAFGAARPNIRAHAAIGDPRFGGSDVKHGDRSQIRQNGFSHFCNEHSGEHLETLAASLEAKLDLTAAQSESLSQLMGVLKRISKIMALAAVTLTGLSAGVALAHLLELPNKMKLSAEDYLWVQQHLYEGFGQIVGPIELGAFLSAIAFTVIIRKQHLPCRFVMLASICITAALAIWQFHNSPVNAEVDAWTLDPLPTDWITYRDRWEYAHAARAGLYTLGLSGLMLAVLSQPGISVDFRLL